MAESTPVIPEIDDSASDTGSESSNKLTENMECAEQDHQETAVAVATKSLEDVTPEPAPAEAGASGSSVGATAAASSIEKLLQQQRNEIMFELRRLQLGERPVTGQGNKEAVEHFFTSRLNGEPMDEQQRPESVIVEVNALVERRPVSSLLQSNRFRRTLENALRSAITTVHRSPRSQSSLLQQQLQQRSSSPAPSQASVNSFQEQTQRPSLPVSTHASSPSPSHSGRQSSLNTTATARSHIPSALHTTVPTLPLPPAPPAPPPIQAALPPPPIVDPQQDEPWPQRWLQQHTPPNIDIGEQGNMLTWEQVEQAQREGFIAEISELVQRQLVTSTLDGQFRNVLENTMQNRMATIGTDGSRVQQFIRNLPQNPLHLRNDFSDLGILGPEQQALSDDVSVISATAAVTVQNSRQNVAMSREMTALKAQIHELKTMMKLSFDLQLDTQRAIRQEVAAALAQALGSTVAPPAPTPPVDDAQCLICLDKTADSVLYQCGHLCVCHGCGLQLKQRGCHCPVCRAPIRDIIRAYKSGGQQQQQQQQ